MSFFRLVGLDVTDASEYARYRDAMAPILTRHGGAFVWDLVVSDALLSPTDARITRAFALRFPDEAAHDAFFSDPDYAPVRARHFDASVASVTPLGRYSDA